MVFDLLIKNIGLLATPTGSSALCGSAQGEITTLREACIGVVGEKIAYVGELPLDFIAKHQIDANGTLATPGLVDAHTHLVFGGWRQHEMAQKLAGASYLDILKAGGGILSTVEKTREASEQQLFDKTSELLEEMLSHGTTTCEAKSGYGLALDPEHKQLRVVKKLQESSKVDVVSTFMGAHAIAPEYQNDPTGYVDFLCDKMIPEIAKEQLATFCDIFCETAVFDVAQTRKILECARKHGFLLKMHADEIDPIGGAELAGELATHSAEHLIEASDCGIEKMAQAGTIAVLLPATSFYLGKNYARARIMIEKGVAVAIASDFNPGSSPNLNLQFPMNLACMKYKLTPEEALVGVTLNAADAIGKASVIGSVEVGKQADIVLWKASDLNYIFYRYGTNLVKTVIKKGEVLIDHS